MKEGDTRIKMICRFQNLIINYIHDICCSCLNHIRNFVIKFQVSQIHNFDLGADSKLEIEELTKDSISP